MVDIATLLGAKKEVAEVQLKESIEFEMLLANVSLHNNFPKYQKLD